MQIASIFGYFLGAFGCVWLACERASDWETSRWSNGRRAFLLVLGAMALLVLGQIIGDSLVDVANKLPQNYYGWSSVLGCVLGAFFYWVYRRYISPRPRKNNSKPFFDAPSKRSRKTKLSIVAWLVKERDLKIFGSAKRGPKGPSSD
jgi:hypothetical protein